MIIKQARRKTASQLKKGKIKNPALEAEILLSHILKKNREFLFTHPEKELTAGQVKNYKKLIVRRSAGEPIAYLTGQKEFYDLNFFVNKNVLIPRPETELMVEEAVNRISQNCLPVGKVPYHESPCVIIDVGTGSGCIIITLAKILKSKLPITNYQLLAIDISKPTLAVAKKNAKLHKVDKKIKFIHGNLLKPILKNCRLPIADCRLIILANLPYLTPFQIKSSLTIKYEPKKALDGGRDGLKHYKKLFGQVKWLVKLKAAPISLFCEIDPGQAGKIKKLAQSELAGAKIKIKKDLAGLNRLAIIENTI